MGGAEDRRRRRGVVTSASKLARGLLCSSPALLRTRLSISMSRLDMPNIVLDPATDTATDCGGDGKADMGGDATDSAVGGLADACNIHPAAETSSAGHTPLVCWGEACRLL